MRYLAADVGGTFTDLVLVEIDPATGAGRVHLDKVSSLATGSAEGLALGIGRLAKRAGIAPGDIDLFVHGFTVGTNAYLTRSGARVAFATTAGFRDLLVIGDQQRPELYALSGAKPAPVVPRSRSIEVKERVDAFGAVVQALEDDEADRAARLIGDLQPESVAVALLFAHLNADHERKLEAALHRRLNGVHVYLSSRINPEIEEYPRASTTAIAAYVGPVIDRYLGAVEMRLGEAGVRAPLRLMRSDGGAATPRGARENPAHMLLSGPAGGVIASAALAGDLGIDNLITFDMGGTSADFSVIVKGAPTMVSQRRIDDQPLRLTALDIETISAGGGSIASVDLGGALKVGPRSAGAVPGPACYAQGGTEPTITDACVVLGILDPAAFLGGEIRLDPDLAAGAVEGKVARPLGLGLQDAAHGILSVASANMCQAIRTLSVERGLDVRGFSLLAFGGAGPVHAAYMARELGMKEVVAPRHPGVFAASGLLMTDLKHSVQTAWPIALERVHESEIAERLGAMRAKLEDELAQDGIAPESRYFQAAADLRCVGQFHVLTVPLPTPWDAAPGPSWWDRAALARQFHRAHERAYGHAEESVAVEIVNLRAHGFGRIAKAPTALPPQATTKPPKPIHRREVFLERDQGPVLTDIYSRDDLLPGQEVKGPAIAQQKDSTILILPRHVGLVDRGGVIRIRSETAEARS